MSLIGQLKKKKKPVNDVRRFSAQGSIFFQLQAFRVLLKKHEAHSVQRVRRPGTFASCKALTAHRNQQEKGASHCKKCFLSVWPHWNIRGWPKLLLPEMEKTPKYKKI